MRGTNESQPVGDLGSQGITLAELIDQSELALTKATVAFGHGTTNARDEAIWLVLWCLGIPLESDLVEPNGLCATLVSQDNAERVRALIHARIATRKPAAYLTGEAWLQGIPFYVDERVIVPRSLIAEVLMDGSIDYWLHNDTRMVLDLCTGNGSLAILAAMVYPDVVVCGSDLSPDALEVAAVNIKKHALTERVGLYMSNGLDSAELLAQGPFDLILCNPPYVNAQSMLELPAEYRAEPTIALDGNLAGGVDGMDFIRGLIGGAVTALAPLGVLVLEIGNERAHFEAAFPTLEVVWLNTSSGDDQVLLITREALIQ